MVGESEGQCVTTASPTYWPQLDGVRGVAVLAVLVSHWVAGANRFGHIGLAGVYVFFVLSGFLITGILIQSRHRREHGELSLSEALTGFFGRRFLRIFPAYYFALFAAYLLLPQMATTDLVWNLAYLGNLRAMIDGQTQILNHFWSLAVEEQFYLVWPLLVLLLPVRYLKPAILLAILLSPTWRLLAMAMDWRHIVYSYPVWSNLDALGLGALLAMRRSENTDVTNPHKWLRWAGIFGFAGWLGCGIATFVFLDGFRLSQPGFAYAAIFVCYPLLVSLSGVYLIAHATGNRTRSPVATLLGLPVLRGIGRISYGIYLYHFLVAAAVDAVCLRTLGRQLPELARFGTLLTATVAFATVSYFVMERPLLALGRRWPQPRVAALAHNNR